MSAKVAIVIEPETLELLKKLTDAAEDAHAMKDSKSAMSIVVQLRDLPRHLINQVNQDCRDILHKYPIK